MKYCADCVDMSSGGHIKGKFDCNNPKSGYNKVSARKEACDYFTECFNSRRCETEREELMRISRGYNCYIIGAIVRTLGLEDGLVYLDVFNYYRSVIMPRLNNGNEWVADYDEFGPVVAQKVEGDELKCSYLLESYIQPFTELILSNNVDSATVLYKAMYDSLKREYKVGNKKRALVSENNEVS